MRKDKAVSLNYPAGVSDSPISGSSMASLGATAYAQARVTGMDRWLTRRLHTLFDDAPFNLVLWNGEEISSPDQPVARVEMRDRTAVYKLLTDPNLHFGDLYSAGRIEVEGDLVELLEIAYRALADTPRRNKRPLGLRLGRGRLNTLNNARDNIHHHYDIGNEFYRLWLDEAYMQYTCAYYPETDMTLEQAQIAKLEHICRKLQLQPGETVVEAGCGWGGLARYMARHYGVKVKSYNISHQQILYARQRAKDEGLADRIEYIEDDYRNITGQFDAFVSVGMLEHVGIEYYEQLGGIIDRCLKPNGRGLLHSIGRNRPAPMNAWIDKRIFPGAYPPSIREMMDIFEPYNFSILDMENLRLHYAQTLRHWLDRFEQHFPEIEAMYDRSFARTWRIYLTGSIAAFTTSELQLFQVMFTRHSNNNIPASRAHLYSPSGSNV